jgi:hypothetical protein
MGGSMVFRRDIPLRVVACELCDDTLPGPILKYYWSEENINDKLHLSKMQSE